MFTRVKTPALLGLPEKQVGVTANVYFAMVRKYEYLHNHMHLSEIDSGFADMRLVHAVPTSAAVAAALRPHLQGNQLTVSLRVSDVH
jgi:hypothetical protein